MFFIISKLAWFVIAPLNFIVLATVAGLILWLAGSVRLGRAVTCIGVFLIFTACFTPLGAALIRPLEDRFPVAPEDMAAPSGIIVLGGALDELLTEAHGQPSLIEGAARLTEAVALARRFPQARLIFTGGSASLNAKESQSEAQGVHRLWSELGVPESQMTFEDASRNTWENAVFTRNLIEPKLGDHWLLVTSAWHMPRAMGIFRRVGFNVTAYPVDFLTFGDGRDFEPTPAVLDELTMLTFAIHEWVGLAAYRLTGKTDALFPGP
jgi:uncharacterized SAM-binding protein YcdF (DUF218 family)